MNELATRKNLLAKGKQLTGERGAIAVERLQFPWVKVERNNVFDSPSGKRTLIFAQHASNAQHEWSPEPHPREQFWRSASASSEKLS
jgi:hypothetical protein